MPVAFLVEERRNPGSEMHRRAAVTRAEQGAAWAGLWSLPAFSKRERCRAVPGAAGKFPCVVVPRAPRLSWAAL